VNELTISLLSALLATNQPQAVSNLLRQNVGVSVSVPDPNDPAEKELRQLMQEDDAALDEVDKWIRDNDAFAAQGAGEPSDVLNRRIRARLDIVRDKYKDFLQRYPDFARGHLAYGTFLNDIHEESAAGNEFKKAAQLDPKDPAAWNNLGNFYAEFGPMTNAFADYTRAVELDPAEPVYYQNLGLTVYLYRRDAMKFYGISEQQVFDKALAFYRKAIQFDPDNLPLATEYAECYYAIRPLRTNDALAAWTNALLTAHNEGEREGIYIHLARIKIAAGRFAEAWAHLDAVTNSAYLGLKNRLERNLAERKNAATNPPAAGVPANVPSASTNAITVSSPAAR